MYLCNCEIKEITPVIKRRYQCDRAITLGTGTYYLGNLAVAKDGDILDLNVAPLESGKTSAVVNTNDEVVMLCDRKESNRDTYFIAYKIPENAKVFKVDQHCAALRFNLDDNGTFCYVGREYPEAYNIDLGLILTIGYQDPNGGPWTEVDFILSKDHTIVTRERTYGNAETTRRKSHNFVDCLAMDRFRSSVRIPNNAVVFVNRNLKTKESPIDAVNGWLAGGLKDTTSVIFTKTSEEISNTINEIMPIERNMSFEFMFYGYSYGRTVNYRNMLNNIILAYRRKASQEVVDAIEEAKKKGESND